MTVCHTFSIGALTSTRETTLWTTGSDLWLYSNPIQKGSTSTHKADSPKEVRRPRSLLMAHANNVPRKINGIANGSDIARQIKPSAATNTRKKPTTRIVVRLTRKHRPNPLSSFAE